MRASCNQTKTFYSNVCRCNVAKLGERSSLLKRLCYHSIPPKQRGQVHGFLCDQQLLGDNLNSILGVCNMTALEKDH